ncbi:hypothetical protein GS399_04790 [Pedobacter sp. HMF7647]|uniref:Transcriptional regulator n=1 Tax=Hufsiella arboris TaxID=2695275 RepID=A0A7K1Y857_9SPHI|nr:hypothetical protein [Hufsiella arboris]MXV50279.1 hypothetical protein [Hufsiella arboris]
MSNETKGFTILVLRISADKQLSATHISLFTALFVCFRRSGSVSPFHVTRRQLMNYSSIASIATYHKCIKELSEKGFIKYVPSYHPRKGSIIYWRNLKEMVLNIT